MTQRIFYCNACGDKRGWPRRIERIHGACSICKEECWGNETPRSMLPDIPKPARQMRFEFDEAVMTKLDEALNKHT